MSGLGNSARRKAKVPTAIDLFAGCGGLSLGLKQAGFDVLCAVEIDGQAEQTYRLNHPSVMSKRSDIRKVAAATLMKELNLKRGELDLLAGCPPCQGFSTLRTRNGSRRNRDRRNNLVNEMLRFARAFLPRSIMMENVPRLADHHSFRDLCSGLRKLNYKLKFDIKDAADFGVPQRRRRLILLASRGFEVPFAKVSRSYRTVRDAIGDLPGVAVAKDRLHAMPARPRSKRVADLIRDIPKNGGSRGDLPKKRQLDCHRKSDGFRDVYGRMAWDKVAPTITGGCFNPSKGRFLHPVKNRTITMREAALLQSFPRSYKFNPEIGTQAIALMIGNALPPEFIRRHALKIIEALPSKK
jgi:DNA (cytosine-5)-methyltransferase 1